MKQGRTLPELAAEVTRQSTAKKDFIAPSKMLRMGYDDQGLQLQVGTNGDAQMFGLTKIAHDQIAERLGIPGKYYEKLKADAPDLLVENVNHWLQRSDEPRLVRTLDGAARAYLSKSYRPMDNYDLLEAVLPAIDYFGGEIRSCEVTERRLYLKVVVPGLEFTIMPPGAVMGKGHDRFDQIQAGLVIQNSEIGLGNLSLAPGLHNTGCTNMAVFNEDAMKKTHLGRSLAGDIETNWELMSDQTRKLTDAALWAQVKDMAVAALNGRIFHKLADQLQRSRENVIEGDPTAAIEVLAVNHRFDEKEKSGVLRHLIEGGELSQYGLHNAVTRMSQDLDDYDRATEMERVGGKIIELTQADWKEYATAV